MINLLTFVLVVLGYALLCSIETKCAEEDKNKNTMKKDDYIRMDLKFAGKIEL